MPLFSKPISVDVVRCVRHFENPGVWVVELADGIVTCLSSSDYDAERGCFVIGRKESLGGVPVLQLYEFPVELYEADRSIRIAQKSGEIQKWEELTAELTRLENAQARGFNCTVEIERVTAELETVDCPPECRGEFSLAELPPYQ